MNDFVVFDLNQLQMFNNCWEMFILLIESGGLQGKILLVRMNYFVVIFNDKFYL